MAQIDAAINDLNAKMQAASQKMYAAGGAQPGAGAGAGAGFQGGQQQSGSSSQNNGDNVQDADFEEVK